MRIRSLCGEIVVLGAMTTAALLALATLLLFSSWKMERGYSWTQHTERSLELAQRPIDLIRQSESELRASIIERDGAASRDMLSRLSHATSMLRGLVTATKDNPEQNERAQALLSAADKRIALLRSGISLQASGGYLKLPLEQIRARSHASEALMAELDARRESFVAEERRLLADRTSRADSLFKANRLLVLIGVPAVLLIILSVKAFTVASIRRQVKAVICSIEAFSSGDRLARIDRSAVRWSEFSAIARGYNSMADRLSDSISQQQYDRSTIEFANAELRKQSAALEARSLAMDHLNAISLRLTASRSDREFAEVMSRFVPKLLPGTEGAIYGHSKTRNQLVRIGSWGKESKLPEWFEPDKCWGLRLVKPHTVCDDDPDLACEHTREMTNYHCEPLMAAGNVVGLLHVSGLVEVEERYRLAALSRELGSALMNHLLQTDLKEQSIRDPLTALFNRRYLEEVLGTELARASRSQTPLSVIMCDVDHFKRFNDLHGHDAGDAVLRAVADEMQKHFRDGDVVCRYGGEEFTVIAPGASTEIAARRVERLRLALSKLVVHSGAAVLPPITASFGIAGFDSANGNLTPKIMEAADEALYRAKRQGRNRAVVAELLAA